MLHIRKIVSALVYKTPNSEIADTKPNQVLFMLQLKLSRLSKGGLTLKIGLPILAI